MGGHALLADPLVNGVPLDAEIDTNLHLRKAICLPSAVPRIIGILDKKTRTLSQKKSFPIRLTQNIKGSQGYSQKKYRVKGFVRTEPTLS